MKKVNYTTVKELLGNDSFFAWYPQTDKIEENKWQEWIEVSKEHRHLSNEAIRLLDLIMMAKENSATSEQRIDTTFDRITNTITIFKKQQIRRKQNK
jgi:hypothetical protein